MSRGRTRENGKTEKSQGRIQKSWSMDTGIFFMHLQNQHITKTFSDLVQAWQNRMVFVNRSSFFPRRFESPLFSYIIPWDLVPGFSNVTSYCCGMVISYVLNKYLTFLTITTTIWYNFRHSQRFQSVVFSWTWLLYGWWWNFCLSIIWLRKVVELVLGFYGIITGRTP